MSTGKRLIATIAATGIALVGLAGCSATTEPAATAPIVETSAHVHALVAEPETNTFLVAMHDGLYRLDIPGTDPTADVKRGDPVGGYSWDFMGLTGASGTLYGSGHPDEGSTLPPSLGLISSADGGLTWTQDTSADPRDYHSLAVAGSTVYGFDSGAGKIVASSDNGLTWQSGAELEVRDLTTIADGAVIATTRNGVMASHDGGATFEKDSSPDELYLIEAIGEGSAIISADTSGALWLRSGDGRWQRTGVTPFIPEALTYAVDPDTLIIASGDQFAVSLNLGMTWTSWTAS